MMTYAPNRGTMDSLAAGVELQRNLAAVIACSPGNFARTVDSANPGNTTEKN
jgi:hypothetical protein